MGDVHHIPGVVPDRFTVVRQLFRRDTEVFGHEGQIFLGVFLWPCVGSMGLSAGPPSGVLGGVVAGGKLLSRNPPRFAAAEIGVAPLSNERGLSVGY